MTVLQNLMRGDLFLVSKMFPLSAEDEELELKLKEFEQKLNLVEEESEEERELDEIYSLLNTQSKTQKESRELTLGEDFINTFIKVILRRYAPQIVEIKRPTRIKPYSIKLSQKTREQENEKQVEMEEKIETEEKKKKSWPFEIEKEKTEEESEKTKKEYNKRSKKIKNFPRQFYKIPIRRLPRISLRQMPRNMNYPFQSLQPPRQIANMPMASPIPAVNLPPSNRPQGGFAMPDFISLGKLSQLLRDPSVFSVECPGPNKNILVNKSGRLQMTQIILTKEEIDSIMEEISERTKIPIMGGLFKAAMGDVLITAVISDYIGSRFVIQKRTPFHKY